MNTTTFTVYGITFLDGPDVTEDNNYLWFSSSDDRDRKALEFLSDGYVVQFDEPYVTTGVIIS